MGRRVGPAEPGSAYAQPHHDRHPCGPGPGGTRPSSPRQPQHRRRPERDRRGSVPRRHLRRHPRRERGVRDGQDSSRWKGRTVMDGPGRDPSTFPPYLYAAYRATVRRSPKQPLIPLPQTLSEITGPGPAMSAALHQTVHGAVSAEDTEPTTNMGTGTEAMGERIIVTGRVLDEHGAPLGGTLVEIWQTNAAGRYRHRVDQDRSEEHTSELQSRPHLVCRLL